MVWNLTRCILILLCCHRLVLALLTIQKAERMLTMQREGPDSYLETQKPVDVNIEVKSAVDVLREQGDAPYCWLALLTLLALSPYKKIRKVEE